MAFRPDDVSEGFGEDDGQDGVSLVYPNFFGQVAATQQSLKLMILGWGLLSMRHLTASGASASAFDWRYPVGPKIRDARVRATGLIRLEFNREWRSVVRDCTDAGRLREILPTRLR